MSGIYPYANMWIGYVVIASTLTFITFFLLGYLLFSAFFPPGALGGCLRKVLFCDRTHLNKKKEQLIGTGTKLEPPIFNFVNRKTNMSQTLPLLSSPMSSSLPQNQLSLRLSKFKDSTDPNQYLSA